jgi:hypothetical protein
MKFFAQCQHVSITGVEAYTADPFNALDAIGNLCCVTAFVLNLCHGHEDAPIGDMTPTIDQSIYTCSDWPVTVPLAASMVLAIGALFKGLLLCRLFRLQRTYGPMLLTVQKMVEDMVLWLVVTSIVVVAFASSFHSAARFAHPHGLARLHNRTALPQCPFTQTHSGGVVCALDCVCSGLTKRTHSHVQGQVRLYCSAPPAWRAGLRRQF